MKNTLSKYASNLEAQHHKDLLLMEKAGIIENVISQPKVLIKYNGRYVCQYKTDFSYWHVEENRRYYDECKGYFHTADKLRFKLFLAHVSEPGTIVRLQSRLHRFQFFQVRLSETGRIEKFDGKNWKLFPFTKDKGKNKLLKRGRR